MSGSGFEVVRHEPVDHLQFAKGERAAALHCDDGSKVVAPEERHQGPGMYWLRRSSGLMRCSLVISSPGVFASGLKNCASHAD